MKSITTACIAAFMAAQSVNAGFINQKINNGLSQLEAAHDEHLQFNKMFA